VATEVRRRRGACGGDGVVAPELEEASIVWQGASGDMVTGWWRQGGEV
jgi:hypothetical protein